MNEDNNIFTKNTPDTIYGIKGGVADSPLAMSMYDGFLNCNGSKEPGKEKGCHFNWQEARKQGKLIKSLRDCTSDWAGGVLKEGISCVDIDDDDTFDLVLGILRAEGAEVLADKSDHGGHIYFDDEGIVRTASTKQVCVLGIGCENKGKKLVSQFDWRIGTKNYMVVRSKGKDRQIVYESPTGKLGPLPPWLNLHPPSEFARVRDSLPLDDMGEGDGRNDTLFRYYTFLRLGLKYSAEDAHEICRIINWYLFKDPMDDNEFESATREDRDWEKAKAFFGSNKGGASLRGSTAIEITNGTPADDVFNSLSDAEKKPKKWEKSEEFLSKNFIYANINDACYVWMVELGIYRLLTLEVVDDMVREAFGGSIKLSDTELKNVKRQLYTDVRATCPKLKLAEGIVPFADGDYLLETDEFLPPCPERAVLSRLPHNKPTCTEATQFVLDSLDDWADGDEDTKKLLCEVMGFCLTGQLSSIQQCILLCGDKQNGKSKFIDLLELIVGSDNTAHLSLKELSERFKSSGLVGKRLNTSDELDGRYIEDTSKFKQLTGQGALTVEKKGKDATPFKYCGVMVFASNEMVHLKDETGAVLRRLVFVNFTHTFEKNRTFEVNMAKPENLEAYIYLALKSARKLWKEGKFTEPAKSNPLIEEFKMLADPTGGWLEEITEDDVIGKLVSAVYNRYKTYALDRGYKVMSDKSLGKLVRKEFSVVAERKWNKDIQGNEYKYVRKR